MAENVTYKVYRVDTGDAVTSVKELRKYIKELQDSLLQAGLSEEEVTRITDALAQAQQTLTEAMKAGTNENKAAADSLIGLNRQYKELYAQYAALSKEQRESKLGTDMAKTLKSLHDEINTTQMAVGNYKANIGNYAGSILEAFSSIPGVFGKVSKSVQGTIGMMGKLKAAMGPIGWAIAALAAAVSLLVKGIQNNNQASDKMAVVMAKLRGPIQVIENAIKGVSEAFVDFADKAVGALEKVVKVYVKSQRFFAKLFDSIGLDFLADGINGAMDDIEKFTEKSKAAGAELAKIAQKQNEFNDERRENSEKVAALEHKINVAKRIANDKEFHSLEERRKALTEAKKLTEEAADIRIESAQKELEIITLIVESEGGREKASEEHLNKLSELTVKVSDELAAKEQEMTELNKQSARLAKEAAANAREAAKAVQELYQLEIESAEKGSQYELQLKKDLLNEEMNEEKRQAKETIRNREVLAKTLAEIDKKYARKTREAERQSKEDRYNLEDLRIANSTMSAQDKALLQYLNFKRYRDTIRREDYNDEKEYQEAVNKLINESIQKRLKIQDDALNSRQYGAMKNYTDRIIKEFREVMINRVDQADTDDILGILSEHMFDVQQNPSLLDGVRKGAEDTAKEFLTALDVELENAIATSEYYKNLKRIEEEELGKATVETLQASLEAEKKVLEARQAIRDEEIRKQREQMLQSTYLLADENVQKLKALRDAAKFEYETLYKRLGETEDDFYQRQLEAKKAWIDADKALDDQYLTNWTELANAVSNVMGSFADAYEEEIKVREAKGKISEKQADKEFEQIKGLRVASSVIETLSGMISAYMSAQSLGVPWGQIIGAANAAAVGAAGWANIRKIQSTTRANAKGASASIQSPTVRYSAGYDNAYASGRDTGQSELIRLNEAVRGIANGMNDMRVYVLENDITTVQQRARGRVQESSF